MTHPSLSENYIADYVAKWVLPPSGSVFQVMGTKKIQGDPSNLKYRLCLSDGIHRFSQAMIYLADADCTVPPGMKQLQLQPRTLIRLISLQANPILKLLV
jgi:hypothetical protein